MRGGSHLLLVGFVGLGGCARGDVTCAEATCPADTVCREEAGAAFCACVGDAACGPEAICNEAGRCQRRPACRSNLDCADGTFCALSVGLCVPAPGCRRDVHCPIGAVCVGEACAPGCRVRADCALSQVCDSSEAEAHPAGLGACVTGCEQTAGCPLAQRCVGGTCYPSPNQSHCAPCSEGLECPYVTDWCLINPGYDRARPETGGAYQCAVDCEGRPEVCPNGYACADVVRLTAAPCTADDECLGARSCVRGEGEARGFCSCARDADCSYREVPPTCTLAGCLYPPGRPCGDAADCEPVVRCADHDRTGITTCYRDRARACSSYLDCLCVEGACVRDGRPCDQGSDCEPTCADGRCRIGAACSPIEGLYCPDLR